MNAYANSIRRIKKLEAPANRRSRRSYVNISEKNLMGQALLLQHLSCCSCAASRIQATVCFKVSNIKHIIRRCACKSVAAVLAVITFTVAFTFPKFSRTNPAEPFASVIAHVPPVAVIEPPRAVVRISAGYACGKCSRTPLYSCVCEVQA